MKTIEELKKEQYDLKAKLHEVIEFTNSRDYYSLPETKKVNVQQCKFGIELYLNALTSMIYDIDESDFDVEIKPIKRK